MTECIYEARSRDGGFASPLGDAFVWCRVHGFACPNLEATPPMERTGMTELEKTVAEWRATRLAVLKIGRPGEVDDRKRKEAAEAWSRFGKAERELMAQAEKIT